MLKKSVSRPNILQDPKGKKNESRIALPNLKMKLSLSTAGLTRIFKGRSPKREKEAIKKAILDVESSPVTSASSSSDSTPERIEGVLHLPVVIIYKGTKAFWRTRCNLDILIVEHPSFNCIEVIAYNAKTDRESSRVYLNMDFVLSKMDETELIAKAELEKENCLRTRKSFIWESLLEDVKQQFVIQYILARINMTGPDPSNGDHFDVFLNQLYSDKLNEETGKLDTICGMPSDLIPYEFNGKKYVPLDELKRGLEDLSYERTYVGKQFAVVHKLVTEARAVMGIPSRGRDDSFAISPTNRSKSQPIRRSIDDAHIMENTSTITTSENNIISALAHVRKSQSTTTCRNLLPELDAQIPVTSPENKISPSQHLYHRSHKHGLKFVNSWGSMNKINDSLIEETEALRNKTLKVSLPARGILSPIVHEAMTPVSPCTSEEDDDSTPHTSCTNATVVAGPRSLLLKKQKSSKKILVRSKSNKKIRPKVITREPSARTMSSPSNDFSVEEQNEREKLKAEENTMKLQSGAAGPDYMTYTTSSIAKTTRFG